MVIDKISKRKLRHFFAVWMIVALALSSTVAWTSSTLLAAPAAQEQLRAQQVAGIIPGGQFAKVWLGLEPETRGQNITITTEWDRANPQDNGLGFYVLDEDDLRTVLSGSARVQEANLSAGGRLSADAPDNQLGAVIQATGEAYTIVLFNDSNADANFTLEVTNAFVTDDSGQVRDLQAAATPVTEEGEEAAEGEEATDEAAATDEADATPAPAATEEVTSTEVTSTESVTATATPTPTATPEAAEAPAAIGTPRVVRAQEVRGELPEQNDQHFLELEPSERDGNVTLTLSFDPQDSSELARRFNFWVLEEDDFRRYIDANTDVRLSDVAIAAGSSEPDLAPNERRASFTASGLGPYIVVVYNNSTVPGSYTLRVDGGVLIDDSGQTLNSRTGITGTATITGTTTVTGTATGDTDAPASAATPAAGGREGEPGGVYVVAAGDTLSLIARDIYGNISYWRAICDYNNLANCDVIEIGDELQLPTLAEIDAGISPSTAAAATPAATDEAEETEAATEETEMAAEETEATGTVTNTGTVTGTGALTGTGTTTGTTGADETAGEAESDTGSTATVDVLGAMEAAGSFNTMLQALEAAGLTDSLSLSGPFTIFAPTDAAFEALPAGALEQLLANPTGQLTQILLFHVLPGQVMAEDVTNGMSATTQQGKAVNFEVSGNSIKVNGASVVTPDIEATNGVVHAIDAVILPPPD